MLYEYAVDPTALGSSWARCRYILDQAGWDVGRLIAKYPRSTWAAAAKEAAKDIENDMEKARVIEAIAMASRYKCIKLGRSVQDAAADWIDDAKLQQRVIPFRAIVADIPGDKAHSIVNIDSLSAAEPLWHCPSDMHVPKEAAHIAAAIGPLIRHSNTLKLIDPFFNVTSPRFIPTLAEVLRISNEADRKVVEIHCEDRDEVLDLASVMREPRPRLHEIIPEGISVRVFWWRERIGGQKFHARHAVSEKGAVKFDAGFSEINGSLEELSLVSEELRSTLFDWFSPGTSPFDQVGECLEIARSAMGPLAHD